MPRTQLDIMAALGNSASWLPHAPDSTAHPLGLSRYLRASILRTLDESDLEFDRIRATFQPAALKAELPKVTEKYKLALKAYVPAFNQIKGERDKLRNRFTPKSVDPIANAARIAVIQSMLPRDTLEAEIIYRDALARGDELVAASIELLPFFHEHRPRPEVLAEGPRRRMEAQDPAAVVELDRLEAAIHDIQAAIDFAESEIDRAAGVPAPDRIKDMAEGKKPDGEAA